ncbi:YezD family protein [Chlorobium sp.]
MRCIADISYGEVVVTIHDARIVQVERREKRRFDLIESGKGRLKCKQGQTDFRNPEK